MIVVVEKVASFAVCVRSFLSSFFIAQAEQRKVALSFFLSFFVSVGLLPLERQNSSSADSTDHPSQAEKAEKAARTSHRGGEGEPCEAQTLARRREETTNWLTD